MITLETFASEWKSEKYNSLIRNFENEKKVITKKLYEANELS